MTQNTVNPAPHAGEKDTSGVHSGKPVKPSPDGDADAKDATSTASKPQGTLQDQIKTMESEGQAQPQSDELPPEERPKGKGPGGRTDTAQPKRSEGPCGVGVAVRRVAYQSIIGRPFTAT